MGSGTLSVISFSIVERQLVARTVGGIVGEECGRAALGDTPIVVRSCETVGRVAHIATRGIVTERETMSALTGEEIAERVRTAAQAVPNSREAIGSALGLDKSNVSRLMSGQRKIGAAELVTIADILGVPLRQLTDSGPKHMKFAARLASGAESSEVAAAQLKAARLVEVRETLGNFMTVPSRIRRSVTRPTTTYRKQAAAELAASVRGTLDLGIEPIADVKSLLEDDFDVDVSVQPLEGKVAGMLLRDASSEDGLVMVIVNSNCPLGRQRLTCAHELGHLLFADGADEFVHTDYFSESGTELEQRANWFALDLLLPSEAVQRAVDAYSGSPEAKAASLVGLLAADYGLSVEATANRLAHLKVISAADCKQIKGTTPKRNVLERVGRGDEYDKSQAAKGVVAPPSRTLDVALNAYQAGLVGVGTMAELLGTTDQTALVGDLEEAGWAPTL